MITMSGALQRTRVAALLPSALAAGLTLVATPVAAPASAQVVISSQARGTGISIDQSVLDALGPATNPQLLDPTLSGGRRGAALARGATGEAVPRSRLYGVPPARSALSEPARSALSEPARGTLASQAPMAPPATGTALPPLSRPSQDWMLAQQQPQQAYAPVAPPGMAPASQATPRSTLYQSPNVPRAPSAMPSAMPPLPSERAAPRGGPASAPPPPPSLDPVALPRSPTPAPAPTPAPMMAAAPPPPAAVPAMPAPAPRPAPTMAAGAPMASAPMASAPPPRPAPAPTASAPVQTASAAGALSRVLFSSGSADLSDTARRELAGLADRLGRDGESRIQLLAYADGSPDSESQARRLSLSRALAVRSYLIEQGIRSTRVNVQALGIKSAGGPADRVDAMAATP